MQHLGACLDDSSVLPSGKAAVVVRSAGFSDGNWAEFWLTLGRELCLAEVVPLLGSGFGVTKISRNGQLLYGTGTRGLTIVEVQPDNTAPQMQQVMTHA